MIRFYKCSPICFYSCSFLRCLISQKHCHLELPVLSSAVNKQVPAEPSSNRKVIPLVQLHSFMQLLENMHRIEVRPPRKNLWVLYPWGTDTGAAPAPLRSFFFSVFHSFYSHLPQRPQFTCLIAPVHLDWVQMEYHLNIKHEVHSLFKQQNKNLCKFLHVRTVVWIVIYPHSHWVVLCH